MIELTPKIITEGINYLHISNAIDEFITTMMNRLFVLGKYGRDPSVRNDLGVIWYVGTGPGYFTYIAYFNGMGISNLPMRITFTNELDEGRGKFGPDISDGSEENGIPSGEYLPTGSASVGVSDASLGNILGRFSSSYRSAVVHELTHAVDHARRHIHSLYFTRISSIQNPELKNAILDAKYGVERMLAVDEKGRHVVRFKEMTQASLSRVEYVNHLAEINAYVIEAIDRLLHVFFIEGRVVSMDDILKNDFGDSWYLLTEDSRRRITKRFNLVRQALLKLSLIHDRMTPEFMSELRKEIGEPTPPPVDIGNDSAEYSWLRSVDPKRKYV